jgi:DNA-binding NtrC family response regulator
MWNFYAGNLTDCRYRDTDPSQIPPIDYIIQHKLSYRTLATNNMEEGLRWIRTGKLSHPNALLIVSALADEATFRLIRTVRHMRPYMPILVLLKYSECEQTSKLMQSGASDFLVKPVDIERLRCSLRQALEVQRMHHYISWLERKIAGHMDLSDLIGRSPTFRQALMVASKATASRKPVWIIGEVGTGKAMFARVIHGSSDRAGKPYSAVNCAMTPSHLIESILFGQEGYTANQMQFSLGKLREADQGTLLLEEIHTLPLLLQQRLVDVLEKGVLLGNPVDIRLGSHQQRVGRCTRHAGRDG